VVVDRRIPVLRHRRGDDVGVLARRVVALGIIPCLPIIVISWLVDGPTDPWVRFGYPLMVVHLAVFSWVLLRRPQLANQGALITLVGLEAWWVVVIAGRVGDAPDAVRAWASLYPSPLLGVIVCLVVGFLFQRTRIAFAHGAAYTVVVTATLATSLRRRPGGEEYVYEALRFGIYLAVVLGLVVVLSVAKERMVWAVARASRATATAAEMRGMAYRDELTGVANRRRLVEELGHQAGRVGAGSPVSVIFFDLDHFKDVNDTLGHDVGDRAICVAADIAMRAVRDGDLVARLGGEEFVIVAPGTGRADAVRLAERLRRALPGEQAAAVGAPITASFGVTELRPGEAPTEVLRRADARMYAAKHGGRDRVESVEPAEPPALPGAVAGAESPAPAEPADATAVDAPRRS
jgi:diguanylate cyclase (GGDEF)-like protein